MNKNSCSLHSALAKFPDRKVLLPAQMHMTEMLIPCIYPFLDLATDPWWLPQLPPTHLQIFKTNYMYLCTHSQPVELEILIGF